MIKNIVENIVGTLIFAVWSAGLPIVILLLTGVITIV